MILRFLGTRGYIEARTPLHHMHASLLVLSGAKRVMFDCGEDWRDEFRAIAPDAVFITHAHPDHAWGLRNGADCPVYASAESWELMDRYPLPDRTTVTPGSPIELHGLVVEAYTLDHSIRAPAVGYRVADAASAFFYAPDVVSIRGRERALTGIDLYIGDGATVERSMVRRRGDILFGHSPVRTQLTWCRTEGVSRAVFTHCGSEIVTGDPAIMDERIRKLGLDRGVDARIAWDGMEVELRT